MEIRRPNCGEISVLVMAVLILIYIGIKTNWGHPQPEVSGDRYMAPPFREFVGARYLSPDTTDTINQRDTMGMKPQRQGAMTNSPSSLRGAYHSGDNMQRFDPASEDDMDDNGMSRYMNAYDDEDWE